MFFVLFRSFLGCCSDSDSEMEPFRNSGTILVVLLLVALFFAIAWFQCCVKHIFVKGVSNSFKLLQMPLRFDAVGR